MNRHILFAAVLAIAVLPSCTKERLMDREKAALQERIDASTMIDVRYVVDNETTKSLSYDNKARQVAVKVELNDSCLVWNMESDREWCRIVEESHKGPGTFTIDITANEDFDDRAQATLTFVAGSFRGFTFTVDQEGSVFLVSQPYYISPKDGYSFAFNVTVQKAGGAEPEWNIVPESWLTATKGGIVSQNDETVTRTVNVSCSANTGLSRLGELALQKSGSTSTGEVSVYQFGTDYNYDTAGNIFFGKDEPAAISLTAPANTVAGVKLPSYAGFEIVDNNDGTVGIRISAENNFSDCSEIRFTETSVVLSNSTATEVGLPVIAQDYVPANGLVTGLGLQKFAAAVSAGESTSDWEKDGVVTLLGDIDMTGITGWTGIGSAEHPFTGKFDGKGFTIDNLTRTACGLFNNCSGAVISNVTLGKGCNIYNNTAFSADTVLGGLVSECKSTEMTSCAFNGSMEFGAKNSVPCSLLLGSLVGKADASSYITGCKCNGTVILSSAQGDELTAYVGGIAGSNQGHTEACECSGSISLNSTASCLIAGGIISTLSADAVALSNSFNGKFTLAGSSVENVIGGLYGSVSGNHTFDFATDKSIAMGNFSISKFGGTANASLFAGGMIGRIEESHDITISGYECGSNFMVDHTQNTLTAGYLCTGGFVGGCNPSSDAEAGGSLKFVNLKNNGTVNAPCNNSVTTAVNLECYAGIIGYINGKAEISNCTNAAALANSAGSTSKSNGKCQIIAGIAAFAEDGDLRIEKCTNSANILSTDYNNNAFDHVTSGRYDCNIQSGILGAFGYYSSHSSYKLTVSECTVTGFIQGYRGITAGVVGYAENAQISGCEVKADFSGSTIAGVSNVKNDAAYIGGLAGVLYKSSVSDCTVKSNIYANTAGSEAANPAGILSVDAGSTTITSSSWYGIITVGKFADSGSYAGGLVANGGNGLKVSDCKYGGSVNGTSINVNNVDANAVGSGLGTISGTSYWDGN